MPLSPAQRAQNARNKRRAVLAAQKAITLRVILLVNVCVERGILKSNPGELLEQLDLLTESIRTGNWKPQEPLTDRVWRYELELKEQREKEPDGGTLSLY